MVKNTESFARYLRIIEDICAIYFFTWWLNRVRKAVTSKRPMPNEYLSIIEMIVMGEKRNLNYA